MSTETSESRWNRFGDLCGGVDEANDDKSYISRVRLRDALEQDMVNKG